jgi:hypothetical protein
MQFIDEDSPELSFDLCFECEKQGLSTSKQQLTEKDVNWQFNDIPSIDSYPDLLPNCSPLSNQEILRPNDSKNKTADSITSKVSHERDTAIYTRQSDIDINLIPDFTLNNSHAYPVPNYSHLVQKDSFTSNNEIQKIKSRIADSVSLRKKHERDAAMQKEVESTLVQELSKLTSHDSRHQLFAHHTDCKLCHGEKGIAIECLDKNCEYSFDLCFDCGEIQNNSPFPIFLEELSEKINEHSTCPKCTSNYDNLFRPNPTNPIRIESISSHSYSLTPSI